METLKEEELRHPAIAAYYVVMLVESGRMELARSFLVEANRATLLPEEQQLLKRRGAQAGRSADEHRYRAAWPRSSAAQFRAASCYRNSTVVCAGRLGELIPRHRTSLKTSGCR